MYLLVEILVICGGAYMVATSVLFTLGAILGRFREETISVRERELEELLGDLVDHIDCARSEENADEVLCQGCYSTLDAAKYWLYEDNPTWREDYTMEIKSD